MPLYVYEIINKDGTDGETFEILQSLSENPLTHHPVTGEPVRRILQPANIISKYTPGSTKKKLENKNVEKAGFAKYERDKLTGTYHKVAGKHGPDSFKKPPPE